MSMRHENMMLCQNSNRCTYQGNQVWDQCIVKRSVFPQNQQIKWHSWDPLRFPLHQLRFGNALHRNIGAICLRMRVFCCL